MSNQPTQDLGNEARYQHSSSQVHPQRPSSAPPKSYISPSQSNASSLNAPYQSTSNQQAPTLIQSMLAMPTPHPIVYAVHSLHARSRPSWFDYNTEVNLLVNNPGMFAWEYWTGANICDLDRDSGISGHQYQEHFNQALKTLQETNALYPWPQVYAQLPQFLRLNHSNELDAAMHHAKQWASREPTLEDLALLVQRLGLTEENAGFDKYEAVQPTSTVQREGQAPMFALWPDMDVLNSGFQSSAPVANPNAHLVLSSFADPDDEEEEEEEEREHGEEGVDEESMGVLDGFDEPLLIRSMRGCNIH